MKKLIILLFFVVVLGGAAVWFVLSPPTEKGEDVGAYGDAPKDRSVIAEPLVAATPPAALEAESISSESVRQPLTDVEPVEGLGMVDQLSELVSGTMSDEDEEKLYELLEDLQKEAALNPELLKEIIDEYSLNPSSDLGQNLASILAVVRGPEVEAMALDLARPDASPEEQVAGLTLISQLGVANEQTLALTQTFITGEDTNPELLRSAIYAMPVMPLSPEESDKIVANLSDLAMDHPDAGVRFNSVTKIVEWAKEPKDLDAVVKIMNDKARTEGDRMSAAIALTDSAVGGDTMRELFMARMADPKELWEIRRTSAEALARFELFDDDYAELEAFKKEQEKKDAEMADGEMIEN